MVSIHVITAYVFIHYKPHYRYYASHNKYPPLKTHQIFTNKVQQYIIHHNARDKPSTGTSNNLSNVHVICKTINENIAQANTLGYILLIRLLYQLSNRSILPRNNVYPEQNMNSASPIVPPVANISYLGGYIM